MKNTIFFLSLALLLLSCGEAVSETESSAESGPMVTRDTVVLGDISLAIAQTRPAQPNPEYSCTASLTVFRGAQAVDSLRFDKIEAVGGAFGFTQPILLDDHILLTKHGDYDGRTLLINREGSLFNLPGGENFFEEGAGLLFSSYDSDLAGLAVFDLKADTLLLEADDLEMRPRSIYKTQEAYYLTGQDVESDALSTWKFDWGQKSLVKAEKELEEKNLANALPQLSSTEANCTCR